MRLLLISLLILFWVPGHALKANAYSFSRLDASHGLVNNQVLSIYKDSKGFVWFGTNAGLSRYDGYRFRNFVHDVDDSTSIADNYILGIQELANGDLLIETRWRYVVYDYNKDRFINQIDQYFNNLVPTAGFQSIFIDNNKQVWFVGHDNQLFLQDFANHRLHNPLRNISLEKGGVRDINHSNHQYHVLYNSGVIEYYNEKDYSLEFHNEYLVGKMAPENVAVRLFVDRENDIWVYSANNGAFYYQASANKWDYCSVDSGKYRLSSNLLKKIVQDDQGDIWVGTDHGGIDIINKNTGIVKTLLNRQDDEKSLSQNTIVDLFKDDMGIIWVATYKKGVCYYHESKFKFQHYKHVLSDPSSLPYNDVNCFCEDDKGNLWIGTNGSGLIYFDRRKGKYTVYRHDAANANSISSDVVVSLFRDPEGKLWIGTFTGGLCSFDGSVFKRYRQPNDIAQTFSNNNIWAITQIKAGGLLLGTLGNGLLEFDAHSGRFQSPVSQQSAPLVSDFVTSLLMLKDGQVLVGTANGVALYDTEKRQYAPWPLAPDGSQLRMSNNMVNAVFEDSRGLVWVATREGLNLFNPKKGALKMFGRNDGLGIGIFNCILEDDNRNIWVSKSDGVSKIVVSLADGDYRFNVYNYTSKDGLQDNEFNVYSSLKTSQGELIFGGPNGFNLFFPQNIEHRPVLPKIIFTDFLVFNRPLKVDEPVGGKRILEQSIVNTPKISLPYHINVFSIEFAAFDYLISQNIRYRYKMEGFDNDWVELGSDLRRVTYTNLNAGDYRFLVEAVNTDGSTSAQPAMLAIEILPPFYASVPAIIIYVLLVVLALIWMRHSLLKRERAKYLLEQERFHARRNHELDELKLRFLTNISHEFRTPLTLIITPLEQLLKESGLQAYQGSLNLIHRNARQLLHLVNQLLDFRKLDLQGLQYNPSHGDIVAFIRDVCQQFSIEFGKKNIRFDFDAPMQQLNTSFDKDKLGKIAMNLLSNALKFTNEKGVVRVELSVVEPVDATKMLVFRVSDTGVGIAADEQEKIFERFYQSKHTEHLASAGSGIGLNLTREMVALHGGTIRVESTLGEGSSFIVSLPCPDAEAQENAMADLDLESAEPALYEPGVEGRQLVLLVEDNSDFRQYMKEVLEVHYAVITAVNGEEGLQVAIQKLPDLIVSDVMMPVMDGHEFCARIKADVRTSHIPFIMLTAQSGDEAKISGFKTGADDYITKPFNMDLLLLRIQKQLDLWKQLRQKFQKHIEVKPGDIEVSSLDEELIKKAIAFVEKNIAEPDFSVEDLSRELGMSRVYLYKKLLAITGKTPIEFIRIIRLKRSAQLLQKTDLSVSEVAYRVGFNNPRYFSKYFKEEFGVLPSAFGQGKDDAVAQE